MGRCEAIEEQKRLRNTQDRQQYRRKFWSGELVAEEERRAVKMARDHGDFALLADLVLDQTLIEPAPSTKQLARDRMTGQYKRPVGHPLVPEEVKRERNPLHDAADEVRRIQSILTAAYPKERGCRARAIKIVAQKRNVDEVQQYNFEEKLRGHFKSGPDKRKDRKRRKPRVS
jgi:hypothetical protein